jgi:hypothetical protein
MIKCFMSATICEAFEAKVFLSILDMSALACQLVPGYMKNLRRTVIYNHKWSSHRQSQHLNKEAHTVNSSPWNIRALKIELFV